MKKILAGILAALVAVNAAWVLMGQNAPTPAPAGGAAAAPQQTPLRIFLRGGPKTHGPATNGQHDGPTFVKEWTPLLEERGAKVAGGLRFPTAEELEQTDVMVMFAADAGRIVGEQRAYFEKFLKRGGGVVALHDAVLAGQEHQWFKTIIGGAWENNVARWFEGESTYYFVNTEHPITKGAVNFRIDDEIYWNLHMMPDAQILASSMQPAGRGGRRGAGGAATASAPAEAPIGRLAPQIWVYENQLEGGQRYRAYVNLLGHHFKTFSSPHARAVILRGIAWVGKRDVDALTKPEEVAGMK